MKQKCFKNLMIEPTNVCNLRCPICPSGNGFYKNNQGFMKFQQFKKIIDSCKNFIESVNLWGFGEPFLAPDIMKMINYLGKNNIFIKIHTNGNVLTNKMMDQFKKNHRMLISFSIDGLTQKTYTFYRSGGSLKKTLANLSYLVNLKQKYNLDNIRIIWQFLVMKTNEHEVPLVKDFARNLGVDVLRFKTIGVNKKHLKYDDFIPINKKYWREKKKVVNFEGCRFINPGIPTISWDGDVVACCHDFSKRYVMGNALKESLLDIWHNSKYNKFRNDYKKGINEMCNTGCKFTKKSKVYVKEFNFPKQ